MRNFSITEKVIFFTAIFIFLISGVILLIQVNNSYLTEVPTQGGKLREGITGIPRFINPILAISDADKDLTVLLYSGLLSVKSDGSYTPNLAQDYSISEDGRTYVFTLKNDLTFHDGTPLTTEDVAFTIAMAQDPLLKSPRQASWGGVQTNIISPTDISFTLDQAYEPFIENFTLGILPKHIWKNVTAEQFQFSQFNITPTGSGPYKIDSVQYNSSGLPTQYSLIPFKQYALGTPYISHLMINLYQSEETLMKDFSDKKIDSINSISTENLNTLDLDESTLYTTSLPRVFGLFFNQDESTIFLEKEVRKALNLAIDKKTIVESIFNNNAQVTHGPIPFNNQSLINSSTEEARELLTEAGWKKNEETNIYEKETKKEGTYRLVFSISTSNTPELVQVAEAMKQQWADFGADVSIKIFETNDLNQNIIRPRNYETLLFGEVVGRNTDLYPFWHSSGRVDPGLNIALYTNITVDKLLEDARIAFNTTKKQELLVSINEEIQKDIPAVFIYSPYFTYVLPNKIQDAQINNVVLPSDRFSEIHTWYIETERIWNIFIK